MGKESKQAIGIERTEEGGYFTSDGDRIIPGVNGLHIRVGVLDKITKTLDDSLAARNADPFHVATIGKGMASNNLITQPLVNPQENPLQGATTPGAIVEAMGAKVVKHLTFQYGVPVIRTRYVGSDTNMMNRPESATHAKYLLDELLRNRHQFTKKISKNGNIYYTTTLEFASDNPHEKPTRNPETLVVQSEEDMSALIMYIDRLNKEKYEALEKSKEKVPYGTQTLVVQEEKKVLPTPQESQVEKKESRPLHKETETHPQLSSIKAPQKVVEMSAYVKTAPVVEAQDKLTVSSALQKELIDPVVADIATIKVPALTREVRQEYINSISSRPDVKNAFRARRRVLAAFVFDGWQLLVRNKGKETQVFGRLYERFKEKMFGLFPSVQKSTLLRIAESSWGTIQNAVTTLAKNYTTIPDAVTHAPAPVVPQEQASKVHNMVLINGEKRTREEKIIDFHKEKAKREAIAKMATAAPTPAAQEVHTPKKPSALRSMYDKVTSFFGRKAA